MNTSPPFTSRDHVIDALQLLADGLHADRIPVDLPVIGSAALFLGWPHLCHGREGAKDIDAVVTPWDSPAVQEARMTSRIDWLDTDATEVLSECVVQESHIRIALFTDVLSLAGRRGGRLTVAIPTASFMIADRALNLRGATVHTPKNAADLAALCADSNITTLAQVMEMVDAFLPYYESERDGVPVKRAEALHAGRLALGFR